MIIILNDDAVYVAWIRRHRNGFVLDTKRKSTKRNTMMHRTSCPEIRKSKTKRTHWTTGGRVKACSEDCGELAEWAREQIGSRPKACRVCNAGGEALSVATTDPLPAKDYHLTKLENDILSAVVESAVIHLDNKLEFQMTVGDVAQYLSKTPALLTVAMRRLVSQHMLELETANAKNGSIPPAVRVFPTANALRAVPAFAELAPEQLQAELETLHA